MAEDFTRSAVTAADFSLSLCGADGIDFKGEKFVPDATKAYFQFKMSHAFPVSTFYGTALHPAVIAKSYAGLRHQNVNLDHAMASYNNDPKKDVRDHVVGSIVAVDFPTAPGGNWQVNNDISKAPGITGVAVVYKQAQGMAKMLGEHSANTHKRVVSMEVFYRPEDSGFAIDLAGKPPEFSFSPQDMLAAGHEYVPYDKAPKALINTFSKESERIVSKYKGRKTYMMMGGLSNPVHYAGLGVVKHGAEPPARITRLAASVEEILSSISDSIQQTLRILR